MEDLVCILRFKKKYCKTRLIHILRLQEYYTWFTPLKIQVTMMR